MALLLLPRSGIFRGHTHIHTNTRTHAHTRAPGPSNVNADSFYQECVGLFLFPAPHQMCIRLRPSHSASSFGWRNHHFLLRVILFLLWFVAEGNEMESIIRIHFSMRIDMINIYIGFISRPQIDN